ncbi:MAG: hypothetical protein V2A69_14310 [Pseudomonadota bacterium]
MKRTGREIKTLFISVTFTALIFAIPVTLDAASPPDRQPPGASSTRYLQIECDGKTYSPIAGVTDFLFPPEAGYPLFDIWVKQAGTTLLDFNGGDTGLSDPVNDFKDEDIRQFWELWKGDFLAPIVRNEWIKMIAGLWEVDKPITVINDIREMMRPGNLTGEEISLLDSATNPRTYAVEFTVPASQAVESKKTVVVDALKTGLPPFSSGTSDEQIAAQSPYLLRYDANTGRYVVPGSMSEYKIRGWFIRGDGIKQREGTLLTPLVIISPGHGARIDTPVSVDYSSLPYRILASRLVQEGFSVLFYNYEASGYSQGWNRHHDFTPAGAYPGDPETGNAVNIFHMIDQLSNGCLTYNPYEGDSLPVARALITEGTPVILYGISHGSFISVKAMQLRFNTPETTTLDYSRYNIKGVIQSDGVSSIKYSDIFEHLYSPGTYYPSPAANMFTEGILRNEFFSQFHPDGSVLESAAYWPAWLGIKAIHDGFLPDSEIETFNRTKGIKAIVTVMGGHAYTLIGSNFPYVINKISEFCRKAATAGVSLNDLATTTSAEHVCQTPYVDLTTWKMSTPLAQWDAGELSVPIVQFTEITASSSSPFFDEGITFTVEGIGPGSPDSVNYKFWYRPDDGASPWVAMQDFGATHSCTYTFPTIGNYVVVAWATDNPNNIPVHVPIAGMRVKVGRENDNVQFLGLTVATTETPRPNVPLTFTANATSSETIYYRFFCSADYGISPWVVMEEYSTDNECTYTFPQPGNYIVVVWGVTDPNAIPDRVSQVGMNVKVQSPVWQATAQ